MFRFANVMSNDDVSFNPPVTVKAGQIQFIEACHPPLVAGKYRVRISQMIQESEAAAVPWNSDPYASELPFAADAPRFALNPADIHSVYPPSNQSGRFDNGLPHAVFTRRTLPWERTLDGIAPKLGRPFPPWTGLLLLQEEELTIRDDTGQPTQRRYEIKSLPVFDAQSDSLLVASDKKVLPPDLGQDGASGGSDDPKRLRSAAWQREQDRYRNQSCLAIDLPAELFKAVAPRLDDLPYLAHVRQVDTGDKEVAAINDKGWFSLVIGNRLPQANKAHRVLLISLEGLQDRLQEEWTPAPGQMLRLAVLMSWSFTCEGSNDFKTHLKRTSVDTLHLPFQKFTDNTLEAADIVNGAYARGYTASDHVLRHGERTVSWYRGPLVPLSYVKPEQIQEQVSGADELLRYDPDTGLFDVSYAAAWQLGRLLALQNQSFALALSRVRGQLRHAAEQQIRQTEVDSLLRKAGMPEGEFIADSLIAHLIQGAGDKLLNAVPGASAGAAVRAPAVDKG
jgi:hypothetical protein